MLLRTAIGDFDKLVAKKIDAIPPFVWNGIDVKRSDDDVLFPWQRRWHNSHDLPSPHRWAVVFLRDVQPNIVEHMPGH